MENKSIERGQRRPRSKEKPLNQLQQCRESNMSCACVWIICHCCRKKLNSIWARHNYSSCWLNFATFIHMLWKFVFHDHCLPVFYAVIARAASRWLGLHRVISPREGRLRLTSVSAQNFPLTPLTCYLISARNNTLIGCFRSPARPKWWTAIYLRVHDLKNIHELQFAPRWLWIWGRALIPDFSLPYKLQKLLHLIGFTHAG